jgi:hypothetical protein
MRASAKSKAMVYAKSFGAYSVELGAGGIPQRAKKFGRALCYSVSRRYQPVGSDMTRRRRYYTDDDIEHGITPSELKRAGRDRQKEYMRYWFHRNFEDPAEETPYNTREGGYLYIWGGPYNAHDELLRAIRKGARRDPGLLDERTLDLRPTLVAFVIQRTRQCSASLPFGPSVHSLVLACDRLKCRPVGEERTTKF